MRRMTYLMASSKFGGGGNLNNPNISMSSLIGRKGGQTSSSGIKEIKQAMENVSSPWKVGIGVTGAVRL